MGERFELLFSSMHFNTKHILVSSNKSDVGQENKGAFPDTTLPKTHKAPLFYFEGEL